MVLNRLFEQSMMSYDRKKIAGTLNLSAKEELGTDCRVVCVSTSRTDHQINIAEEIKIRKFDSRVRKQS